MRSFLDKNSNNKVTVFSYVALSFMIVYVLGIISTIASVSGVVQILGWARIFSIAIKPLIISYIVTYVIYWLPTIKSDFSQQGTVLLNVSMTMVFSALLTVIVSIATSNLPTTVVKIVIFSAVYGLLGWLNWKYVDIQKNMRYVLLAISVAFFLYEVIKLFVK
ncbi:hypothetical protein [Companilactobacillus ginsenosidimutans]|uniref:Uncharacterized protein n=1 Tax=Companilactobacillus ginsenosidimutans TaxID=1007676 RepID=A0A0H4QM76_9LACO|nr:hypothetical protein [Companilactobacillus ginsenosidimutans]AKP67813.1 hypothetical protein ABM34_09905 [Companilactobacillus ginsenosidimutans]